MTWLADNDVETNIVMSVGSDARITFLVSPRYPDTVTLALGNSALEISFEPARVEELRDKADEALRKLRAAVAEHQATTPPELTD